MKKLLLGYFGSPDFSAGFLKKIIEDGDLKKIVEIEFVVTQPDRPVGRKQILTSTPVKTIAKKHNIEVFEIDNLKTENSTKIVNCKLKIQKTDLVIVYAYSGIIPQDWLALPRLGFWCVHPSLLPKYRGTSPMATALINDDHETGVTIIKMDEKIDHGPIITQEKYKILATDKRSDLEKKLTDLGFMMFKNTVTKLKSLRVNELKTKEQDHSQASYTKKLKKEDGFIQFSKFEIRNSNLSKKLYNLYRGLYPWPGLWTILPNGKRLKITNLIMNQSKELLIKSVQLEGKKEVDFTTFNKAYKLF